MWQLIQTEPLLFVALFLALIYALTVHEFAHAYAAWQQGDQTAKDLGRLTLNPLAHLDVLGVMMLVFVGFGWGKPVPVNPANFRRGKLSDNLVSLAGIGANLLSCLLFIIAFKIIFPNFDPILIYLNYYPEVSLLAYFLSALAVVNLIIAVFNLLPIPPLDGSHLFLNHLPERFAGLKNFLSLHGPTVLLVLLLLDSFSSINIFGRVFVFFLQGLEYFYQLL